MFLGRPAMLSVIPAEAGNAEARPAGDRPCWLPPWLRAAGTASRAITPQWCISAALDGSVLTAALMPHFGGEHDAHHHPDREDPHQRPVPPYPPQQRAGLLPARPARFWMTVTTRRAGAPDAAAT